MSGGGITTAVLAHGLDTVYPKENERLADKILEGNGLLISEYMIGKKPTAKRFVERDRIQAGMSNAVIVTQTDLKGGTMHTANYAMAYERNLAVYVHPIEQRTDKARGNDVLLKKEGVRGLKLSDDLNSLLEGQGLGYGRRLGRRI